MEAALVTRGSLFAGFRRRQIRLAVPGSRSGTHCDPDDREGNQGGNLGAAPELSPRAILDADTREDLRGKSLLLGHKGLVTHTVSVSMSVSISVKFIIVSMEMAIGRTEWVQNPF